MINLKKIFKNTLPLTPKLLVQNLQDLNNKIVVQKSALDEIALMATNSDITSLFSVAEVIEIAQCIKSRGTILLENDDDPTLCGGTCAPVEIWTLCNEGTDVSILIAWIDKSGSSIIYHRLEMYVDYATNKVRLADAFYKSL